ncbi:hypothetical protein, partial [Fangia hongkongensis]
DKKLKTLITNYITRYQKCFDKSKVEVIEDAQRNKVVKAIAENSKDALLPVLALSLATMISVFERLVLLDIAKRSASSMIKQYGSMIFHKPAFTDQLQKMYQDEESLGQVLEAVIYQLLPELERYAESIDSNYWLESLKKVYVDVKPRLMVLSNSLQKHGNMAATYVKKAKMYLHDEEKVEIKQQAYLTLLTNINHYLNQQIKAAPYSQAGKEFDYGTFVNSAIITQESMESNVQKEKEALEKQVAEICSEHKYPLETKMFFYSMLRGGMWTLFSTHPIPLRNFLLSSVDTKFLMCAFLDDEGQDYLLTEDDTEYATPSQLFMDINKELVLGYRPDYMIDWLLLESAQDARKGHFTITDFNKLVIWLHFLDEEDNPMRASLLEQIRQVKLLFSSFKLQPKAMKKTITAILVYTILQSDFLYKKIKPLSGTLSEGIEDDVRYNQIIDNIADYFRYDEADMPGPMYYILFGLYTVLSANTEDFFEAFGTNFKPIALKALNEEERCRKKEISVQEAMVIKALCTDCDASKRQTVKQQIELTIPVIQENIHKALKALLEIFSVRSAQESASTRIQYRASQSVTHIQERLASSSLYQSAQNVVKLLKATGVMIPKSTSAERKVSYFQFVKNGLSVTAPDFVTTSSGIFGSGDKGQLGWNPERFSESEYVPITRMSNSQAYSGKFLKAVTGSDSGRPVRLKNLKHALTVLSYPAFYTLINREVQILLDAIGSKAINKSSLPDHTSSITVAASVLMMGYLAKTSYVFDTKTTVNSKGLSEKILKVTDCKLDKFGLIDTEYEPIYRQLYEAFNSDFVCPFELVTASESTEKSAHQTAMNRLLDESVYESASESKGKGVFLGERMALDSGLNWFDSELSGKDLLDPNGLFKKYDSIKVQSYSHTSQRLYKLKKYFHDFNGALS